MQKKDLKEIEVMTEKTLKKVVPGLVEEVVVRVLNKEIVPIIENIDKRLTRVERIMATKEDIAILEKRWNSHEKRLDRHAVAIDRLLQS